ncbi:MAG: hypothetical protein IBX55_22245 [Methyloprofundus sp.]|nr:hypothetical protein [Methyloprofundus sp.]
MQNQKTMLQLIHFELDKAFNQQLEIEELIKLRSKQSCRLQEGRPCRTSHKNLGQMQREIEQLTQRVNELDTLMIQLQNLERMINEYDAEVITAAHGHWLINKTANQIRRDHALTQL